MIRGATPAAAMPTTRAKGSAFFAAASSPKSNAAAPSFTPDALPAVTVFSGPVPYTHLTLPENREVSFTEAPGPIKKKTKIHEDGDV